MNMLHVNIHVIIMHADIDGSHVNIIMLHVAVICLACRRYKYATMVTPLYLMKCFGVEICIYAGTDPDFFSKGGLGWG